MTTPNEALLQQTLEVLDGITNSSWREWHELASAEEFERWVKARTNHAAIDIRAALALPEPTTQPDEIHSCSFFCDLPGCIKTQRDLLRDQLCKKATP